MCVLTALAKDDLVASQLTCNMGGYVISS